MQDDFNIEKERVIACVIDYTQFLEEKEDIEREEKVVNDFLASLPEERVTNSILEIKDIERLLENDMRQFKVE